MLVAGDLASHHELRDLRLARSHSHDLQALPEAVHRQDQLLAVAAILGSRRSRMIKLQVIRQLSAPITLSQMHHDHFFESLEDGRLGERCSDLSIGHCSSGEDVGLLRITIALGVPPVVETLLWCEILFLHGVECPLLVCSCGCWWRRELALGLGALREGQHNIIQGVTVWTALRVAHVLDLLWDTVHKVFATVRIGDVGEARMQPVVGIGSWPGIVDFIQE